MAPAAGMAITANNDDAAAADALDTENDWPSTRWLDE